MPKKRPRRIRRVRRSYFAYVPGALIYSLACACMWYWRRQQGYWDQIYLYAAGVFVIVAGVLAVSGFVLNYLRTDDDPGSYRRETTSPQSAGTDQDLLDSSEISRMIRDLDSRVESLAEKKVSAESTRGAHIEEPNQAQLVEAIRLELQKRAAEEVLDDIRRAVGQQIALDARIDRITKKFDITIYRLRGEVAALRQRSNLNLLIGILTTLLGLGVLAYFVGFVKHASISILTLAADFGPRLALVTFIEIFAYFFLRLYKASLDEIKYFQNEMTNVEARLIALNIALETDHLEACKVIALGLSATERNHILEKGQTTVELEKRKLDKEELPDIGRKIAEQAAKS